jgi:hypothetical protein
MESSFEFTIVMYLHIMPTLVAEASILKSVGDENKQREATEGSALLMLCHSLCERSRLGLGHEHAVFQHLLNETRMLQTSQKLFGCLIELFLSFSLRVKFFQLTFKYLHNK